MLWLQNIRELSGGVLDNFFMSVTAFGEIIIPMAAIALVYWCINTRFGTFMLWNWGLGTFFCEFLKSTFCIYRPWILDSRVHPIESAFKMAGGYSFPSGHSQTAISVWGALAYCFKNKFITVLAVLLILLIGFSRNYAGVHTPQDVLAAYAVALVLLFIIDRMIKWEEKGKNRDIIILSCVICAVLMLLVYEYVKPYPLDFLNGKVIVDPAKMRLYAFPKIGLILGTFIGWFLNKRFLNFDGSKGSVEDKLIRYGIGMTCMLSFGSFGVNWLNLYLPERVSMFLATFVSSLFLTYFYPLILTKIAEKSEK
ncbi:MAG: phosphatase PAP2 family protein [Candidatus Gastranaerophilales bacterium]|nr:phosphatase PAP2 family protein [Candidatus Gastranaerophilales bacterium]